MSGAAGRHSAGSGLLLALSTLVAAVFIAAQAWYARVAFVEASETRLLEGKLDICFENFDQTVALDMALRRIAPGAGIETNWPPRVVIGDADRLARVQDEVVPLLNALQSGLTKASILGSLEKHRAYLAQTLEGLSQRLLSIAPGEIGKPEMDGEIDAVFKTLSEFLGAQYLVFTGCRLVAEGKA